MLICLARGEVTLTDAGRNRGGDAWRSAFEKAGLAPSDAAGITFADFAAAYAWRRHYVAAAIGPVPAEARSAADAGGWVLFDLPADPASGVPQKLADSLRD